MAQKRGWKDWVKGIALYGMAPNGDLILIRTDEQGNLTVNLIPHHTTHEQGGSDEIDVTGLKGVLANLQKAKWSVYDTRANFPSGEEVGALAYATDEKTLYRWDGASWVKVLSLNLMQLVNRLHAATHESGGDDPIDFLKLTNRKHASKHESGGDDEINVDGLHGELADPQTPKAHASTHQPGGSDALPTGVPSAITEGATGSEGSSTKFARADHVHQTPSEWTPKTHGNERHSPDFLAVDGSNAMQAKAKLSYGADLGLTTSVDRRTNNLYIARWYNIGNIIMLDYQDEFTFLCSVSGRSVSVSPSPDGGDVCNLFWDDSRYIWWNSETSCPDGIVITIDCSGNPIPHRYAGVYRPALTFRGSVESYPTHVKVEDWDNDTSTWVTVIDQDIAVVDNVVLLPAFTAQSSDAKIHKLRITLSVPSPLPATFRIQRVILYHPTQTWDPWHLHKGGDVMYGDIDMNGNDILSPGLVDGVDVSSHAARHHAGGADPINVGSLAGTGWGTGSIFDGIAPTSWTSLDLSSVVGSRRTLVVLMVFNGDYNYDNGFYFRWGGSGTDFGGDPASYPAANKCKLQPRKYGMVVCTTNDSGVIEWMADNAYSTKLYVLAYINIG